MRLAGLLCGAAFALVLLPAAAGAQTTSDFFGVNVEPMAKVDSFTQVINGTDPIPESSWGGYLTTLGNDGLSVARSDAPWYWVEPDAPSSPGDDTFDWNNTTTVDGVTESMDQLVTLLAENGIRYIPVLDSSPGWAWGSLPDNGGTTELQTQYYQDYANYVGAFAARYGPNGTFWKEYPSLPYLPVEQYEVWTEANSTDFWTEQNCGGYNADGSVDTSLIETCASDYATGLTLASAAIHKAQPSATVLASIGWQNFSLYVTDLYQALAANNAPSDTINGIGMHPYGVDAQFILELDEQLRTDLGSVGYPDLPIYDTEDGQPVVSSGPGAEYSWDGYVTDASRAAMISLAGDALARSDCGVDDYLAYGLVGSGVTTADGGEPNDEGLMGLWSLGGDQPDATADALVDSAALWQADPSSGIVLCSTTPGAQTPAADLLPLGLQLSPDGSNCVTGTVSYRGNPLEGAYLELQDGGDTIQSAAFGSNADGQADVCASANGPPITSYDVYAEVWTQNAGQTYYVAQSPSYDCSLADGCVAPPVAATPSVAPVTTSPLVLSYKLYGRILAETRRSTKLKAQLIVKGASTSTTLLSVWVRGKGRKAKNKFVTRVTLRNSKALKFKFGPLPRGEHVLLKIAADNAFQRPPLSKTLTVH